MTLLANILCLLKRGEWITMRDLQDTYFYISICPNTGSSLFVIRTAYYHYTVFPFWISADPRAFTNTMVVIATDLWLKKIVLFSWMEDWLLIVDSKGDLLRNIQTTLSLLQKLGLCVNWKKIQLCANHMCQIHSGNIGFRSLQGLSPPT